MKDNMTSPLTLNKKSRSSRFASWGGKANSFRDKLMRCLYIFLLFAIDFAMFVYSINGRLLENGTVNPAVLVIVGGIFCLAFVLILLCSFSKNLQNALCGICTMLITVAFFYQFGMGDVDNFIEKWLDQHASWLTVFCFIPAPWMVGLFLGILVFFIFRFSDAILFVTLVLLFSSAIGIQRNEFLKTARTEYEEVKTFSNKVSGREDNMVYLFIPKLPSYQFLNSIKDPDFRDLRDLLIGFFAVNNFELYPNAFVQKTDAMSNIIDIFNQVDYTSTTSASRGYAEFINHWNFIHGGLDILSLEDNKLYSYLKNNGFRLSTYSMPGFDFCMTGGDFNTDRCVVKGYKTVTLYDHEASLEQNVYGLLGEWVMSLKSRNLNSVARMLINMSLLKNMKILAENRRVTLEGSVTLFDKLADDVKRDANGVFYAAYADLPSDVFVYDEFCQVKPRREWVALKDNSLYSGGIDEKRKAYVEQTKCLIGKLQEYMETIAPKLKTTDIIVQGVSPVNELAGVLGDQYSRFVAENLVTLAIRKKQNPKFLINANVCLASDFTKTYINYQDFCYSLDDKLRLPVDERFSLRQNLINNAIIRHGTIFNIIGNFRDWYQLYKEKNHLMTEKGRQKSSLLRQQPAHVIVSPAEVEKAKSQDAANIFSPTDEVLLPKVPVEEPIPAVSKSETVVGEKPVLAELPSAETVVEEKAVAVDASVVEESHIKAPSMGAAIETFFADENAENSAPAVAEDPSTDATEEGMAKENVAVQPAPVAMP